MIDIDSYDLREVINGIWLLLNIALAFVFWRHVWIKARRTDWYNDQSTQAAIALAFYFTGSTVMRSWVWVLLLIERRGDDQAFLGSRVEIPLLAALLAVTGALCCIRVFSPEPWGRYFWIGTGIIAIAIPVGLHFIL